MRAPIIVGLIVTALGVGACGEDDSENPLSRAEITQQANTVCRDLQRLAAAPAPRGREQIAAYFERTLPPMRRQLDKLPAPDRAPEAIAQDYERFVRARQQELAALDDVADTVSDLVAAAAASQRVERLREESQDLAAKLRFRDCRR